VRGRLPKIISGGQTGADRAALDWALDNGVECGGWCPRGRRAEDRVIPVAYPLSETPLPDYAQRTQWNVRDSDATVIFSLAPRLTGGSRLTRELAVRYGKPCVHLHPALPSARLLRAFLDRHPIRVLNVAGPRASGEAELGGYVRQILDEVLGGGLR
jgi:hypothetical protein